MTRSGPNSICLRIEVIGEGKRMERLQPAVIGKAPFGAASDFLHLNRRPGVLEIRLGGHRGIAPRRHTAGAEQRGGQPDPMHACFHGRNSPRLR
jgi:hypothetical protein